MIPWLWVNEQHTLAYIQLLTKHQALLSLFRSLRYFQSISNTINDELCAIEVDRIRPRLPYEDKKQEIDNFSSGIARSRPHSDNFLRNLEGFFNE